MNKNYLKSYPGVKNAAKVIFGLSLIKTLPIVFRFRGLSRFFGYCFYFVKGIKTGDTRQRRSGMTSLFYNGAKSVRGFTLIELLVVVLIVGILAAVALPQYEVAVMKSKMSGVLPIMRAVKEANERFYLQNGYYTDDLGELDVQVPRGDRAAYPASGQMCYLNGTCFDNLLGTTAPSDYVIVGGVGSGLAAADTCSVSIYYDHSSAPGRTLCGIHRSAHPKCVKVCKSLGY